ncbi:hypothetical protein M5K25_003787 [Dendrobium thyrsiflorum]|uniref:glucose-6-phosphate isomerase n=1 Tax=Dendrobium thyrsiflorum TaxID=117978 RepID=A0ABD0VK47_DENTH
MVNQGITVYGNKGSTDQHAYIQQLREGVHNFFVTFIEVLRDRPPGHDWELEPGVTCGDYLFGMLQGTRSALYANDRESITVTVQEVNPRSVGALIALYERAVGIYASLVNINAYHQPGVEAGKKAAGEVLALQKRVLAVLNEASVLPLWFPLYPPRFPVGPSVPCAGRCFSAGWLTVWFLCFSGLEWIHRTSPVTIQLGRGASIQLVNAVINIGNTRATIQFGGLKFSAATVKIVVAYIHVTDTEGPIRQPHSTEAVSARNLSYEEDYSRGKNFHGDCKHPCQTSLSHLEGTMLKLLHMEESLQGGKQLRKMQSFELRDHCLPMLPHCLLGSQK